MFGAWCMMDISPLLRLLRRLKGINRKGWKMKCFVGCSYLLMVFRGRNVQEDWNYLIGIFTDKQVNKQEGAAGKATLMSEASLPEPVETPPIG